MSARHKEATKKTTLSGSGTSSASSQSLKMREHEARAIIKKGPVRTGFLVLALSVLIWVLAERSVVEELTVDIRILLDDSRQDIRLQYFDLETREVQSENSYYVTLEVKGPRARIQSLAEKKLTPRIVPLGVQQLPDELGDDFQRRDFTVAVMDILDGKLHFDGMEAYLQVTRAKPGELGVRAQKLTEVLLEVQVFDASGSRKLNLESIEPKMVTAWMEPGVIESVMKIPLNLAQRREALSRVITVAALIPNQSEMMDFKIKLAADSVTTSDIFKEDIRAGIVMPPEWAGRYFVQIEEADYLDKYAPIEFRGSSEAREEFKNQRYHLVLEVEQEDLERTSDEWIRLLRYLRPEGFTDFEFVEPPRKPVRFSIKPMSDKGSSQE